jgi:hypothetical protein
MSRRAYIFLILIVITLNVNEVAAKEGSCTCKCCIGNQCIPKAQEVFTVSECLSCTDSKCVAQYPGVCPGTTNVGTTDPSCEQISSGFRILPIYILSLIISLMVIDYSTVMNWNSQVSRLFTAMTSQWDDVASRTIIFLVLVSESFLALIIAFQEIKHVVSAFDFASDASFPFCFNAMYPLWR